jgi:uncharacterized protein YuzE
MFKEQEKAAEVNALYIRLMTGKVDRTVEWEEMVYVDLDANGHHLALNS